MTKGLVRKLCVLFLLPALLLTGCWQDEVDENTGIVDSSAATSAPTSGGHLALPDALSLPYYPSQTLDPITCGDGIQQTVGSLLYEGLFELDETLEPQNQLCTDGSYDPASLTWTFTLRSGVKFSDGTALTAEDVAATLKRAKDSSRYRSRLSNVASISAPDSGTVVMVLNSANAHLPALLDIPIVKSGTESSLVPIGTGPYTFSAGSGKEEAVLTSNAGWWKGQTQPIDRIALVAEDSRDTMLYQFSSHEIQLITADLTGTDPVSATGNVSFYDADTTILQYVGFNTRGLFANAALRSALSLGINRSNIVSAFLSGHAAAAQFPVSPVSPLYPSGLEDTYSYESFKKAMAALGYTSGSTHNVTMIVNSENSFKVSSAREIASALSAFNLHVTVDVLPWAQYTAALSAGKYDLYYGEVKLTPDWNLNSLLSTGGSLNYGGYSDPTLDLMLNEYAATTNPQTAMLNICSYLKKQAPILPVCFKRVSVLTQEGVIDHLTPTAANPFYNIGECTIHLAAS